MDRQEKMKAKEGSENGSENGSNDDSDSEDKVCLSLRFPQISISTIIVHKCWISIFCCVVVAEYCVRVFV